MKDNLDFIATLIVYCFLYTLVGGTVVTIIVMLIQGFFVPPVLVVAALVVWAFHRIHHSQEDEMKNISYDELNILIDKLVDCEQVEIETFKHLVPYNFKFPDGKIVPHDKSSTRQAFKAGVEYACTFLKNNLEKTKQGENT